MTPLVSIFFYLESGIYMNQINEDYNKVVVFTPSHILEEIEQDDLQKSHEDMLYSMLSKEAWSDQDETSLLKWKDVVMYHDNIVNLNAAHIAFQVGFSVLFETKNMVTLFVSSYVSDEMIHYIEKNYGALTEKYLGFFAIEKDGSLDKVKQMETNFEGIPFEEQYKLVFTELLKTLYRNNQEWKEERMSTYHR